MRPEEYINLVRELEKVFERPTVSDLRDLKNAEVIVREV